LTGPLAGRRLKSSYSVFADKLISLIYLISLFFISHLSSMLSLIYPASSPAGRIPSRGGIAHPQGKHSRRVTVFCLPTADFRLE
jgi:hypothetical protein